jgi:hypothetical protein
MSAPFGIKGEQGPVPPYTWHVACSTLQKDHACPSNSGAVDATAVGHLNGFVT